MRRITIKNIREKPKSRTDFSELKRENYFSIDLEEYVGNSLIKKVFLRKKTMGEISDWVCNSLEIKPVREVGGFLFGKVEEKEKDVFSVSLDHFIPDTAVDFSSPNRLEFGALVQKKLDGFMAENQQFMLLGWFHTHPGIGPYLSQTDLRMHLGFFREKYQLAIVLDSLTPGFDTGIFTRKSTGGVSNKEDFKHWISWKAISTE